jgi:tRNA dimethylallyltransferase
MNKLLVIVGPTSSGKSELAIKLAKFFNGEIISCDSRQIYKGMDLGTGKINGKWLTCIVHGRELYKFVYKNITHHLIDFLNPSRQYSAGLFQRDAKKIIADILQHGKLPILCGGTAHWIDTVIYNQTFPNVKPNLKLRGRLQKQSTDALFYRLMKLDPARAKTIDRHNKHRLIRALEIVLTTGKPVTPLGVTLSERSGSKGPFQALWLGIKIDQKTLHKKIDLRLKQRITAGMIKEVKLLHKNGLSWKRLMDFGLEYKYLSLFLQKKITKDEMFTQLSFAIKHYAKRQMTWWKRNKDITWITNTSQAKAKVSQFLS